MGVPQGTVIGVLLFIIYIHVLLSLKIDGTAKSYADDTVLIFNEKIGCRQKYGQKGGGGEYGKELAGLQHNVTEYI